MRRYQSRVLPAVILDGVHHSIEFACKHEEPWGVTAEEARERVRAGGSVAGAILLPRGEDCPRVPPPFKAPPPPRRPTPRRAPKLATPPPPGRGEGLRCGGVVFPAGTRFLYRRGGREFEGLVEDGALVVNGQHYTELSPPLAALAGRPINGWLRWWVARPGESAWSLAKELRAREGEPPRLSRRRVR